MKVFRFLFVVSIAVLFAVGTAGADPADPEDIIAELPVGITIGGSVTAIEELGVEVRNVSDNALNTTTFSFPAPGAGAWVVANQYILVDFDSNYPEWGIHLVTKNLTTTFAAVADDFEPKILNPGEDGEWGVADVDDDLDGTTDNDSEAGWDGSDDVRSYGGLIYPDYVDNPEARADLAWRAFDEWVDADADGAGDAIAIIPDNDNIFADFDEVTGNINPATDNWNADWKYVVDESNSDYDTAYVREWNDTTRVYEYNYAMCAFGYGDRSAHTSSHTAPDGTNLPDDADTNPDGVSTTLIDASDPLGAGFDGREVALYIAATLGAVPAIPDGEEYTTEMWVQLIKE